MEHHKYSITIVVEPDDDGFYAHCPGLPGVFGCGDTEEEALQSARDGAIGILQTKLRFNDPIEENPDLTKIEPKPSKQKTRLRRYEEQITVSTAVHA